LTDEGSNDVYRYAAYTLGVHSEIQIPELLADPHAPADVTIRIGPMHGPEAGWPTDPLWQPVYGVALAGNLLVVLGLPAILAVHGSAARRLTLVGYVGIFAPLAMLNVAETTIEAFVKPYLATHGGFPDETPAGLNAFEAVALVLLIVGAVCLAVAVFRARVLPVWVGVAVLLSVVCAFFLHGGPVVFVSDYVLFAALFWIGLRAVRQHAA